MEKIVVYDKIVIKNPKKKNKWKSAILHVFLLKTVLEQNHSS